MPAKESYQPLRSARSWPSAPGGSHAAILDMLVAAQIALAIPAGVVLVTLLWLVGTRLQPPAGALIVPFVAATAARLLAFMPIPLPTAAMMLGGSAYWPARPSHHQARRTMYDGAREPRPGENHLHGPPGQAGGRTPLRG